jgi:hypothetical protein
MRQASQMYGLRILVISSGIGRKSSLVLLIIQVGISYDVDYSGEGGSSSLKDQIMISSIPSRLILIEY